MEMIVKRAVARAVAAVSILGAAQGFACTRVLWNEGGPAILVGRTMDWPESTEPILTVLPRGLKHNGGELGGQSLKDPNPLIWASKYGSLVTTVYGLGAADGLNEHGLAVHMLYLNATDFGARDKALPGVHAGLWAQYALDNAASVPEALDLLTKIQVLRSSRTATRPTSISRSRTRAEIPQSSNISTASRSFTTDAITA